MPKCRGISPACWVHQRYPCANKVIASGFCKVLLLDTKVPVAQNPPWLKRLWVMSITPVGRDQARNSGCPIILF